MIEATKDPTRILETTTKIEPDSNMDIAGKRDDGTTKI
jgi:hypothetical protein